MVIKYGREFSRPAAWAVAPARRIDYDALGQ
jgi:hypothetical protein